MTASDFYKLLVKKFPFKPTLKQTIALEQLSNFIFDDSSNALYLLKGFAGTGKTSITGTIVTHLWHTKKSAILLAPTGRAAKVISNYSKKEASLDIFSVLERNKVVNLKITFRFFFIVLFFRFFFFNEF